MHYIEKEFEIHYAHRLWNQRKPNGEPGRCTFIHGHTAKVRIAFGCDFLQNDMVVDFTWLKDFINEMIDRFDHHLLISSEDPLLDKQNTLPGALVVPFVPTAENLSRNIYELADSYIHDLNLSNNVHVVSATWFETPTASAVYTR